MSWGSIHWLRIDAYLVWTLTYNIENFLNVTKFHNNIGLEHCYWKYWNKMLSNVVVQSHTTQDLVGDFSPHLFYTANVKATKDICQIPPQRTNIKRPRNINFVINTFYFHMNTKPRLMCHLTFKLTVFEVSLNVALLMKIY